MDHIELQEIIVKGEDSRHQFKENIHSADQLAQEMVAFSNSLGGTIIIGITDRSEVKGLTDKDIRRLNQLVANVATENVKPQIFPETEIVNYEKKKLLLVHIPYGANKPYCTHKGIFFTRSGSDKRKVSQDELKCLFQESGKLYADEMIFREADFGDVDRELFRDFYQRKYGEDFAAEDQLVQTFENLNLASGGCLNLSGILLFTRNPMKYFPLSQIIAVSFFGTDIAGSKFRDSENIEGNLKKLYHDGLAFLMRNIKKIQNGQNFNSPGIPEVPPVVFEELLINALIHRDYFLSSNIRLLIFDDRIEIISPGKLHNNLTVEKIKRGVAIKRNHTLASFAFDIIPYRGIGSGILRALKHYPHIDFDNDVELDQFKAIIHRPPE
jgi:ATP-dependent DNA helicase RecG